MGNPIKSTLHTRLDTARGNAAASSRARLRSAADRPGAITAASDVRVLTERDSLHGDRCSIHEYCAGRMRVRSRLNRATEGKWSNPRFPATHERQRSPRFRKNKRPILFLPNRRTTPGIPTGETVVDVEGTEYAATFVKIAVNVLRRPGNPRNELATVLRQWFGPDAGLPGTNFHVVFRSTTSQRDDESLPVVRHLERVIMLVAASSTNRRALKQKS